MYPPNRRPRKTIHANMALTLAGCNPSSHLPAKTSLRCIFNFSMDMLIDLLIKMAFPVLAKARREKSSKKRSRTAYG